MGVVNEPAAARLLGGLWRSRATTVALLLSYALWLGSGLWIGARELHDKDKVVSVRLNFSAKRHSWIELEGQATLYTLRKYRRECRLLGPARLKIARSEGSGSVLRIVLECEQVTPESRIVVVDEMTGSRHSIDDLRPLFSKPVVGAPRPTA